MHAAIERDANAEDLSDAASDLGAERLEELQQPKMRAIELPLEAAQRDRLEQSLRKQTSEKAAKRARALRVETTPTFNRMLQRIQPSGQSLP
eukprot:5574741-Pyramimonas_sp.AAC.1